MPIFNHTFEAFHKKQQDIEDAIKLLKKNGYKIEKQKDETRSQIYSS
jgi:translation elongation factor EF-Ts